MRPILKMDDTQQSEAFQLTKEEDPYFFPTWHFHPEVEIMLVQEGSGIRFMNNSMERFQAGDLVLCGGNLPHQYRSGKEYYHAYPGRRQADIEASRKSRRDNIFPLSEKYIIENLN